MKNFRICLAAAWVLIMSVTLYAIYQVGINWPAIYFGDLVGHPWRSQFNTDFLIYLLLTSTWMYWREASKTRGLFYGFLNIFLGGMFGFMYLLLATYKTKGNISAILLGSHYKV